MSDSEYAEYRCSACKKEIKSQVLQCTACVKLFYHPGCVSKHKVYNKNKELVKCEGPFNRIALESEKESAIKKTPLMAGNSRDRLGSTGSIGSNVSGGTSKPTGMDVKIDWLVRTVKEMRDEMACKKEIKMLIKEIIREEIGNIKLEFEELKQQLQGGSKRAAEGVQKSYCEAAKEKKKESVIIVTPRMQQESEATKKVVKEKVDIKNLAVGVTKLRKGNKGTVILGCESGEEMDKLKTTVQEKLGEDFKITEPKKIQPKIKVLNVGEEEMKLDERDIVNTIIVQNKLKVERDGFYIRILKKIDNEGRNRPGRRGKEEGSLILEVDELTHETMLQREKLNIGWRKCVALNYISVKRCYKCWGYYHIAKNCTRQDTCHKCAGNHKESECTATEKRCVNCMHKIKAYNLKISDEHDALSRECPSFIRALDEIKKKVGWKINK